MRNPALQLDDRDNVLIALTDLKSGTSVRFVDQTYELVSDVPAKHKFSTQDLSIGDSVFMYGVMVGKAVAPIRRGEAITTQNVKHQAAPFAENPVPYHWRAPEVSKWRSKSFLGYHRSDGQVGTRNYWLVIPLVFCENGNLQVLKQAFEEELGFARSQVYRRQVAELVQMLRDGREREISDHSFRDAASGANATQEKPFANIDGIKFLMHEGGCGGTREDSNNLCALLAGYIHHPNVAGATVLSLGCQNAQISVLKEEIHRRDAQFAKPLYIFEQQQSASESRLLSDAIRSTFLGLIQADKSSRQAAPLSALTVGLKCGGSDGFSGISANPALGHVADTLAALGGRGILAEFPELCGVEQDFINRAARPEIGARFIQLMHDYAARARAVRSGFDMNPSPGNIRDGLVTDAMKSAGAAKKGGTSPVTAVLDYPEYSSEAGLNLLCTPGNDVECVTGQVGAGANIVLFTTGLGTPTGNPVAPVMKISTNSTLADRMGDIIDFDAGGIISGEMTIEQAGDALLEQMLRVASGQLRTKAEILGQDDFIPWKRGVSL